MSLMKSDRFQVKNTNAHVSFYGHEIVPLIREILREGGSFDLTVSGTSMFPTLKPERDQVRLVFPNWKEMDKYPILFFQRDNGTYVLHRMIRKTPEGLLKINGDAQVWTEQIRPDQAIGVVNAIRRKGRWISVKNPWYGLYVMFWRGIRPLRPGYFWARRIAGRLLRHRHGKGRQR